MAGWPRCEKCDQGPWYWVSSRPCRRHGLGDGRDTNAARPFRTPDLQVLDSRGVGSDDSRLNHFLQWVLRTSLFAAARWTPTSPKPQMVDTWVASPEGQADLSFHSGALAFSFMNGARRSTAEDLASRRIKRWACGVNGTGQLMKKAGHGVFKVLDGQELEIAAQPSPSP